MHVWSFQAVVCETQRPGLVGPPGFHTTAREPKRAHLSEKHHQNSTRRHPEREEKNELCGGTGKKKSDILGGPGEGLSGGPREGRSPGGDGLTLDLARLPFHWVGPPECSVFQLCSTLGELGGQLAHDSEETPCCSPVDHRPVDQPVRWLPLERREHQPRASVVPTWVQIADGFRPGQPQEAWEGAEPGVPSQAVEECFFIHGVAPRLTDTQQALVRSQCGPLAAVPFTCCPTSSLTRFDTNVFRVLLLRRFWRPLPLSSSVCRCGRPLHAFGHHRSACAVSGVLGRRGFALESAAARVCREARGRVSLNVRVGDLLMELWTRDDLKWSWMGCRSSMARSSPSTQRWSPRSGVMEDLDLSAPEWTELHWPVQGDVKKPPTPSSREPTAAPGWWWSVVRWEVDGLTSVSPS